MNKITYERIDEKTPSGADYSEIFYLDENYNTTDKEVAVNAMIRECSSDGTLLMETYVSFEDPE